MYRSHSVDTPNNTFLFLSITHSKECDYYITLIVHGVESIPIHGVESIPIHGVESIPQLLFYGVKSIPIDGINYIINLNEQMELFLNKHKYFYRNLLTYSLALSIINQKEKYSPQQDKSGC